MILTARDNLLKDKRVHPLFRDKMEEVLRNVRKEGELNGLPICLVCVYRSPADQLKLFLKHITKMRFPKWHGTGRACDFAFVVEGHITWKVPQSWWVKVGECAEKHGLEWSGRWKRNREYGHLQLTKGK